jgi:serine/threonine-protein kinase
MVPSTSYELAEAIRQAELLKPPQVAKLASEILPNLSQDPQELAFALVQRGWLTSFQAEQALQGNAQQLHLGGYILLAPIGTGGMGQIYKAWQKRLSRTVALKVIRPELMKENPGAVRRFKREALAVAQLSHPNIVSIYDADEADGTHFIALELVDGPDLERMVLEGGPLPIPVACEYVRQTALGLQHAFEAGLVHRDIKPSNLLIARPESGRRGDGRPVRGAFSHGLVKILDMGLARMSSVLEPPASLTREGAMMGTPDYVAPEQARDASSADIRSDLYSLGATFYFLLTGRVPFPDGTMLEKLLKHQHDDPTPIEELRPETPPEVAAIVRLLMAKRPEYRFQTPIELVEALVPILGGVPVGAARPVVIDTPTPGGVTPTPGVGTPPPRTRTPAPGRTPPPARTPTPVRTPPPASHTTPGRTDTPREPTGPPPPMTIVTAVSLQGAEPEPDPDESHLLIRPAHKMTVLRGHKGPVMGVSFSPDGKVLATGGVDGTVNVWSLGPNPREIASMAEPRLGDVQAVAVAPNGEYLVSGYASLDARLVRWAWREPRNRDRTAFEGPGFTVALAFSPDGQLLTSAVGATIWVWDVGSSSPRKRTVLKNQSTDVKTLLFTRDGKTLASGDADGVVQLRKLGWLGGRPGPMFRCHRGAVSCLAFSADGQLLATAGLDHTIRIWDGTGVDPKVKAILQGTKGIVRQMMFLPDARMLLTVCDGGQVVLWSWPETIRAHQWRLEQPLICSLALASDGSLLAAGSTDGTATIYDLVPERA